MIRRPMVGWRVFRISFKRGPPMLTSYVVSRHFWEGPVMTVPPGKTEIMRWLIKELERIKKQPAVDNASLKRSNDFWNEQDCLQFIEMEKVGIHSYRSYKKLMFNWTSDQAACGSILNYGIVNKFKVIYRAEKCLITKLFVDERKFDSRTYNFIVREFQKRYQCPVKRWQPQNEWGRMFFPDRR